MKPTIVLVISVCIQLIFGWSLSLIFPGFRYTEYYPYIYTCISAFTALFLPAYLYLKHTKKNFFSDIISDVKIDSLIFLAAAIGIITQFTGILANLPINIFLSKLGAKIGSNIPRQTSILTFFISILCYALLPAILEEILFRKITFNYFRQYGNKAAVIISSLLFALMHLSFENFAAPFVMGMIFAVMMVHTNRLIYPIIAHFTINAFACTVTFLSRYEIFNKFYADYILIMLIIAIPSLVYLLKNFISTAQNHKFTASDNINSTKESVYIIDDYNSIKIYEHDIKENNLKMAIKDLLFSPSFAVFLILFIYIGVTSLW